MIAELIQQKQIELIKLEQNFKEHLKKYKTGIILIETLNNSYMQFGQCQRELNSLKSFIQ